MAKKDLKSSLDNLAATNDILSDSAIRAKKEKEALATHGAQAGASAQSLDLRDDFTQSVRILTSIFEQSKFDEMSIFISNPTRVLGLNLFIGIIRGVGFSLGLVMVGLLLVYLYKSSYPTDNFLIFIEKLIQFIRN